MAASLSVQRGMWNNLNANGIPPFTQINLTIELGYIVGARVETKLRRGRLSKRRSYLALLQCMSPLFGT
jgi:hypothetical protein